MSLVGTLGRIAVGVALAKGVGKMVNRGGGGGGLGGALGGALSGGSGGGGLGGLLGGGSGGAGGLGGLLGGVLGGSGAGGRQQAPGGGLGDLGALLGGGAAGGAGGGMAGGLGGLLESMSGGAAAGGANAEVKAPVGGSLGDLLNSSLQGKPVPTPEPAQEDQARVLIKAMVMAAKSDGKIDESEQEKIVANLGDEVSDEERQFVLSEMQAPLDLNGLLKEVPRGAEMQVYMMSLLGIDLDSREEAQYLDSLRKGMNMNEEQCNAIHQKMGVPTLYG